MFRISKVGSLIMLGCISWAYFSLDTGAPTTVNAGMSAWLIGGGLLISILLELQYGYKNLLRTDLICILGLYFLTLYEFLFAQAELDKKISANEAYGGLQLILIGFFFLVIGRHLYGGGVRLVKRELGGASQAIRINLLLSLFYACFFLGFFYILLKVNFNPITMIDRAMGARFSQPWSRGRLGGAFVFLSELQLFTYAIPPLAGILLNNKRQLSAFSILLIYLLLSITFFMGFVGGTRNIFLSYLVGFAGGFILSIPQVSLRKLLIPGVIFFILAYLGATYMIQFRSIGLKRYLAGQRETGINADQVYVDHNLYTIGVLSQTFPAKNEFLGMEVFVWALVKPIPRVLWSGKPEGLSKSMEEVAGAEGYTLAATYVGESYMAGGIPVVIFVSLMFGYLAAWWNGKAEFSGEALLKYALGLFVAGITMRSLFMFTTAVLPIFGVNFLIRYLRKRN